MRLFHFFTILFLFLYGISCDNQAKPLAQYQLMMVKNNVQKMMDSVSENISLNGPIAWLEHFENSPEFFMASDGQLVFPNIDSAESFIRNILVNRIHKIKLEWSDVQVDPISISFAGVAANWHEDITDSANKTVSQSGYFTAIAVNTSNGWRLRNAHWSATK